MHPFKLSSDAATITWGEEQKKFIRMPQRFYSNSVNQDLYSGCTM